MDFTHVFFDLNGVLVDTGWLAPQYRVSLGNFLASRYGGAADGWADAYRRVVADWDSYYADLDFSGEDSLDHLWEGQTRVLRALFRLTGHDYPPPAEMRQLVEEYHYPVCAACDALYVDAVSALVALHDRPLTLGLIAHSVQGHARGLLTGSGVAAYFTGPVITPETAGYAGVDEGYYRLALTQAASDPQQTLFVTANQQRTTSARQISSPVIRVDRALSADQMDGDPPVLANLSALPDLLHRQI